MDELVFRLPEKQWMSMYVHGPPRHLELAQLKRCCTDGVSLVQGTATQREMAVLYLFRLTKNHCRDFRGKSTWVCAVVDELLSRDT